ncbi:MAG: hypothetical protein NC321_07725 [Clostridium sp.]|nr:hypothetical protein [Clostridium sp.]
MNLLLDTTIQIDRMMGAKERKKAVEKVLKDNTLFCSTYVLGEYYSTLVNDFVTLYALFMVDKNVNETGKKINECIFGRSQARMYKLYFNILEICDNNIEEIEDAFSLYVDLIQDAFYDDIENKLIDITKCARANREITYEGKVPTLPQVSCTKEKNICNICPFWKDCQCEIDKIMEQNGVDKKIIDILKRAKENEKEYRGRNCMTLGDTIISLEALKDKHEMAVCSSNKKDFQPICEAIGVDLVVPDYSHK